ncbi:MAG: HAD family phosphatase [Pseudomonadota bacterium]
MSSLDHIVFDVGRVLVHWDPELAYLDLIPDKKERSWFLENVCTPEWNIEQDRGRPWNEAESVLIADFPDHEEYIRAFRQNWHKMVPHEQEESVEILRTLIGQGRDITLLTNFAADTFSEAGGRFEFLNETRGATVSGLVGYLKPEREIYDLHANTFGLEPSATLFIDDSEKNVEGAKQAGWNAVLFTDVNQLRHDLAELGVVV